MIAALSLDSSYLFMRYWPPLFIFISKCETSDNSSVSKFGSVFFTLTRGISLQSLLLRVLSLSFRFFSCSSVQSLLRPKKQGWSQKGASLWDKWSFHHYSPTLSNQRMPVKLISILIKVEILRAQRYRYVAVYRKRGEYDNCRATYCLALLQAVWHIAHTWRTIWHAYDKFKA